MGKMEIWIYMQTGRPWSWEDTRGSWGMPKSQEACNMESHSMEGGGAHSPFHTSCQGLCRSGKHSSQTPEGRNIPAKCYRVLNCLHTNLGGKQKLGRQECWGHLHILAAELSQNSLALQSHFLTRGFPSEHLLTNLWFSRSIQILY